MSVRCHVAAVVVTHNRRELLQECLEGLLAQTRSLDEIVVVDNASTDGTEEIISVKFPQVSYIKMKENMGGAGGFHEGMKVAYHHGHDWIWMMDDDTVPDSDALEALLAVDSRVNEDIGFLCSQVVWTDGSPHKMNVPKPYVPYNGRADESLVRVAHCSFVAVAVSRGAVKAVGLPIKEMFINGDDIEFTERISDQFPCYHVLMSRVIHKTEANVGMMNPAERLWRYFYLMRNTTYLTRRRGWSPLIKLYLKTVPLWILTALQLKDHRLAAMRFLFEGLIAGIVFRPKIERV